MAFKSGADRPETNYEQCRVLLLSAFFCVIGQKSGDVGLRRSIEVLLVDLAEAEISFHETNVVQLFPEIQSVIP